MVSKNLFPTKSNKGVAVPVVNALNNAGGTAYKMADESALVQYAITGCLGDTYYVTAEAQLDQTLALAAKCSPEFVAKTAVYARKHGYMKDIPAVLVATLSNRDLDVFKKVFPIVIDDFKMLRNFVQVVRSGVVGRKSFGTAVKRQLQKFFDDRTDEQIFRGSIGNDPALADILKMVHPKPKTKVRSNLYSYLLGKEFDAAKLPPSAAAFEKFKKDSAGAPPEINFQFLSNIKMSTDQWVALSKSMTWQTLRMNLNTLARNGVFKDETAIPDIAKRLANAEEIEKSKVFPYQLLTAYLNVADEVPAKVKNALQDAMEIATKNVPALPGKTVVCCDISGSMQSPVTGYRAGATTKTQCIDVASLMSSTVLRTNEDALILAFTTNVTKVDLNARDSVMTNTKKIKNLPMGGTDCSAALRYMNEKKLHVDNIIMISDCESWYGHQGYGYGRGTPMAEEWKKLKARCPNARMVCIDITPGATVQVVDSKSMLNIGGFNDRVFDIVSAFFKGDMNGNELLKVIKAIDL